MKTNKKFLGIVILLFTVSQLFAVINDRSAYVANYVKLPTIDHSRFNSTDVEVLVSKVVPEEVKEAFLYYTASEDEIKQNTWRLQLLAAGRVESEWTVTKSHHANANGSYDYGYLMLNENNFTDQIFLDYYVPTLDDGFTLTDKQEWYMITCINFYKDLYSRYGCDAWYCYNAGERRYITHNLPIRTLKYKKDIADELTKYLAELYAIADERIAKENEYKRFIAYVSDPNNIMNDFVKCKVTRICESIRGINIKTLSSSTFDTNIVLEFTKFTVFLKPTAREEIEQKTIKPTVIFCGIDDDDALLQNAMSAYRGERIVSLNAELVSRQYNFYI